MKKLKVRISLYSTKNKKTPAFAMDAFTFGKQFLISFMEYINVKGSFFQLLIKMLMYKACY